MTEEKSKSEVTIIFKGAVNMEVGSTLSKALEAARFLTSDTGTATSQTQTFTSSLPQKIGNSPLEAIKNSNAKTFPQQITALAAYVMERNKAESFDPKEIQLLLRRIGNLPQNFGRDLRHATHVLSYLAEEGPNQYILTDFGKESLTKRFEGAVEGMSRRRKPRGKKTKNQEN